MKGILLAAAMGVSSIIAAAPASAETLVMKVIVTGCRDMNVQKAADTAVSAEDWARLKEIMEDAYAKGVCVKLAGPLEIVSVDYDDYCLKPPGYPHCFYVDKGYVDRETERRY